MTRIVTVHSNVRKSHRQPQCTLQLVCEDLVLFVWADLHVPLCSQQQPNCRRAVRLVYPPSFCKLCCSSNPTNKNLKELGLEFHTALSQQPTRIIHTFIWSYSSTWLITSHPKILTLPSESPCTNYGSTTCSFILLENKKKQSLSRPVHALRVPGGWGFQIWRQSTHEVGKVISLTHRPPVSAQEIFLVLICIRGWLDSRAIGHKNSNDNIGNRTRDIPAWSTLPQPTSNYIGYIESKERMAVSCELCGREWLLSSVRYCLL